MIKIENVEIQGFEPAIRGMRNPMNSWDKSDSGFSFCDDACDIEDLYFEIGPNDLDLMKRLAAGGPVHAKYRRMLIVYADVTAPLYWWKEYDTYKVGTVANSCSTMHKIHAKPFELDDFSHDQLTDSAIEDCLEKTIEYLNIARKMYIKSNNKSKAAWWQMIQLLPSSYNQKRTIMLSYEVLHNIYICRRNHKLDEWHKFCDWIESLPYAKEIIDVGEKVHE